MAALLKLGGGHGGLRGGCVLQHLDALKRRVRGHAPRGAQALPALALAPWLAQLGTGEPQQLRSFGVTDIHARAGPAHQHARADAVLAAQVALCHHLLRVLELSCAHLAVVAAALAPALVRAARGAGLLILFSVLGGLSSLSVDTHFRSPLLELVISTKRNQSGVYLGYGSSTKRLSKVSDRFLSGKEVCFL